MKTIFKNCILQKNGNLEKVDITIVDRVINSIVKSGEQVLQKPNMPTENASSGDSDLVIDFNNCYILPGLADVHVHLREPGFFYKETIKSGTSAAAKGGFTALISMPNLDPVPDSSENLKIQEDIIAKDGVIEVFPLGAITKGEQGTELVDYKSIGNRVVGFSDDGKGVQIESNMRKAMEQVKEIDGIIVAHCEDEAMINGGYVHQGEYAQKNGHLGICSQSEWGQLERDINLVRETDVRYHVCHMSTKESVELVRRAKAEGLKITCETAPHYLWFDHNQLKEEGKYKMNPPLRGKADQRALIEGLRDGTIDIIATDHAPHSAEEKAKGLKESMFGIVGLETSFAAIYTKLVVEEGFSLNKITELMSGNPRKIFRLNKAEIAIGAKANFTVIDLEKEWHVDVENFISKGRATPFEGKKMVGEVKATVLGEIVYLEQDLT